MAGGGIITTAVKLLMEAGVTGERLLEAIAELEGALPQAKDTSAERRRARDREYQAERRRQKSAESADSDDLPSLEVSPQTPLPNPIPELPPYSPPKRDRKKKGALTYRPPDFIPAEPWEAFVVHRQAMRGIPFTDAAAKGVVSKIEGLMAQGHCPQKLLEKAVMHGWRTVFENEDTKGYSARAGPVDMDEYQGRLARIGRAEA